MAGMRSLLPWLLCVCANAALAAPAASGEEVYKAKCSACHDSGAGQAPRVSVRGEWTARAARGRDALYESAVKGMPNTAMAAKGGYADLSDAEVRATVDYMLMRAGINDVAAGDVAAGAAAARSGSAATASAAPAAATAPTPASATVDDARLLEDVAAALQKSLAPNAPIDRYGGEALVRGINIRVGVAGGVVTLAGAVEKGDLIPKALAIAKSVPGVRGVQSRLLAAGMLDFD